MNIPEGLPTLSAGAHTAGEGKACFMEYASLLAGEEWSDTPACTNPVIANAARRVNDIMTDESRHLIADLIPSVIGTSDDDLPDHERRDLRVRLALWCARQVAAYTGCEKAALAACAEVGAFLDSSGEAARELQYSIYDNARAAYAACEREWAQSPHPSQKFFALSAHRTLLGAVSESFAAYCEMTAALAARASADGPEFLRGLIAEHARLTGHQPSPQIKEVWESTDFAALISATN